MSITKTVITSDCANHTSRPNSEQSRRKSSANMRINLVDSNYFLTHIQYS